MISLRQTWAIWWSILPSSWPVMYSDLGNLSNLTPVVLGFGKIDVEFSPGLNPDCTISRQRLRGFRGLLISQRSQPHSLQGRRDWSYWHELGEDRHTHMLTKMDQSAAVAKAEEKKLFWALLQSLFFYEAKSLTLSHYLFPLTVFFSCGLSYYLGVVKVRTKWGGKEGQEQMMRGYLRSRESESEQGYEGDERDI